MIEIRRNPSTTELNWFGLLLLGFFGVTGGLAWRAGSLGVSRALWMAGALVASAYYAIPRLRRPTYLAWMYAAAPLGWLTAHAVMAITYFGLMAPIGLLMRMIRGDAMKRQFEKSARSYWTPRPSDPDVSRYFKQF